MFTKATVTLQTNSMLVTKIAVTLQSRLLVTKSAITSQSQLVTMTTGSAANSCCTYCTDENDRCAPAQVSKTMLETQSAIEYHVIYCLCVDGADSA